MDYVAKRIFFLLLFILIITSQTSCTFKSAEDYITTFEKISFRPIKSYGSGGIYWISNDLIVLSAYIDTELRDQDHAIYQVDINDGTYLKIVDIPDGEPLTYTYCFDGETLFVRWSRGTLKVMDAPVNFKLVVQDQESKKESNHYSTLRCKFFERPEEDSGFSALKKEDGFLKYTRKAVGEDKYRQVFLTDNNGNIIKHLIDQKLNQRKRIDLDGRFSVRRIAEHDNLYFGNSLFEEQKRFNQKNRRYDIKHCTHLNWLYRDTWETKQKELCFNDWSSASKSIFLLKDGLFIQTHATRSGSPNAYVIHDEQGSIIDSNLVRDTSVSRDGCKVAYGFSERYILGKPYKLKIFNFCDFKNRPEPSILGLTLTTGDKDLSRDRKTYNKEPFYFVD
jgi:hypothetical protein